MRILLGDNGGQDGRAPPRAGFPSGDGRTFAIRRSARLRNREPEVAVAFTEPIDIRIGRRSSDPRLIQCLNDPGKERPVDISAKNKPTYPLLILRRY